MAGPLQPLCQVGPLDVLGDDVAEAVVGPAHVVDGDDARVVEPGEGAGLGQVGLDILATEDPIRVGHLDRHGAVEIVVLSQIDPAETAMAQESDHPVATELRGHTERHGGIGSGGGVRRVLRRVRAPERQTATADPPRRVRTGSPAGPARAPGIPGTGSRR